MRRERRLVYRVLRLWKEMAQGRRFPRRDQIEPSMLGEDWANCLVIAVRSPVRPLHFVAVGDNLLAAHGPSSALAGIALGSNATGGLGTPLPSDRGSRNPGRYRYPISKRPVPAI